MQPPTLLDQLSVWEAIPLPISPKPVATGKPYLQTTPLKRLSLPMWFMHTQEATLQALDKMDSLSLSLVTTTTLTVALPFNLDKASNATTMDTMLQYLGIMYINVHS